MEEDKLYYYKKHDEEIQVNVKGQGLEVMRRPTKVIIDCDPGGDDAQALILALHLARKHGIEVLGVTTVAGNATLEHVVLNAQLTLSVCKEPEVPIFRGEEPWKKGAELSEYFWGPDGFGGLLFEHQREGEIPMTNVKDEPAVEFLIRMSKEQPGEITIIALAPLSNIAAAIQKDESFPSRVKNIVMLGGTYLAQGNTDYYCSEFNFFKDPQACSLVFDYFSDITMVPIEATYFQRYLPQHLNYKPYSQTHTAKGRLVADSYKIAYSHMKDHYDACDPIAVAVAMHPEVIDEVIEKRCYIETEGSITRGTVIVDWFERYPIKKPRPHVKIVTKVKGEMIVDLMTDSVLE